MYNYCAKYGGLQGKNRAAHASVFQVRMRNNTHQDLKNIFAHLKTTPTENSSWGELQLYRDVPLLMEDSLMGGFFLFRTFRGKIGQKFAREVLKRPPLCYWSKSTKMKFSS